MDMSVSRMSFFCPLSPTKTDFSRKDTTWMKRLPPCRRTGRTGRTYIGFDVLCIWYRQIWTVRESNSVATDAQLYPKIRGDVCLIGTSSQEYYNINMHETIFYSFGHFIIGPESDHWLCLSVREGCGKSKWKFKMAFAMKGGGSRGGLECHIPILKNDFC